MPRPSLPAVCVALAAALAAAGATAQDAPAPLPATPDATECTVAPRAEAEVRELATAALAALEEPATPAAFDVAAPGEPADPETVAAVTATVRGYYACQNAGDYLAALAFSTDERAGEFVAAGALSIAQQAAEAGLATPAAGFVDRFVAALTTPDAIPAENRVVGLVDVRDVTRLADGRVAAVVEVGRPAASTRAGTREEILVFVEHDGGYLIAGEEDDLGAAAGTPTP